jgi:hypothetical protein
MLIHPASCLSACLPARLPSPPRPPPSQLPPLLVGLLRRQLLSHLSEAHGTLLQRGGLVLKLGQLLATLRQGLPGVLRGGAGGRGSGCVSGGTAGSTGPCLVQDLPAQLLEPRRISSSRKQAVQSQCASAALQRCLPVNRESRSCQEPRGLLQEAAAGGSAAHLHDAPQLVGLARRPAVCLPYLSSGAHTGLTARSGAAADAAAGRFLLPRTCRVRGRGHRRGAQQLCALHV